MRAEKLPASEILTYDYIVAMDRSNVEDLVAMGVPRERIRMLTDYVPGKEGQDVPDPDYTGNFEEVYQPEMPASTGRWTRSPRRPTPALPPRPGKAPAPPARRP